MADMLPREGDEEDDAPHFLQFVGEHLNGEQGVGVRVILILTYVRILMKHPTSLTPLHINNSAVLVVNSEVLRNHHHH